MRPWCLAALLLCACDSPSSQSEQSAPAQVKEAPDQEVERGEAALATLRPRPLPMPGVDAYVDLTLVLRAQTPAPTDEALTAVLRKRLESLGLAEAPLTVKAGQATLTARSLRTTDIDTVRTALTLAGRLRGATVPRRYAVTLDDNTLQWRDLLLIRAAAETSSLGLAEELVLNFTLQGGADLQELTAPRRALAILVDDRELSNAAVDAPISTGQLRMQPHAGLTAAGLTAALTNPLLTPLVVESVEQTPVAPRTCTDAAPCEADCQARIPAACLGLVTRGGPVQQGFAEAACRLGVGFGCTRLFEQPRPLTMYTEAAGWLLRSGWLGRDRAGAAAIYAKGCERGNLDACQAAISYLVLAADRTADYATADHMLTQIRDDAALAQVTLLRKQLLDQAKQSCDDAAVDAASAAQACLFAAQTLRNGVLANSDRTQERTLLRRAGNLLKRPGKP